MSRSTIVDIKCDGDKCDKHRSQDTNHWLVGAVSGKKIVVATDEKELGFPVAPSNRVISVSDFCGEECAIKWVSKQLSEIKK